MPDPRKKFALLHCSKLSKEEKLNVPGCREKVLNSQKTLTPFKPHPPIPVKPIKPVPPGPPKPPGPKPPTPPKPTPPKPSGGGGSGLGPAMIDPVNRRQMRQNDLIGLSAALGGTAAVALASGTLGELSADAISSGASALETGATTALRTLQGFRAIPAAAETTTGFELTAESPAIMEAMATQSGTLAAGDVMPEVTYDFAPLSEEGLADINAGYDLGTIGTEGDSIAAMGEGAASETAYGMGSRSLMQQFAARIGLLKAPPPPAAAAGVIDQGAAEGTEMTTLEATAAQAELAQESAMAAATEAQTAVSTATTAGTEAASAADVAASAATQATAAASEIEMTAQGASVASEGALAAESAAAEAVSAGEATLSSAQAGASLAEGALTAQTEATAAITEAVSGVAEGAEAGVAGTEAAASGVEAALAIGGEAAGEGAVAGGLAETAGAVVGSEAGLNPIADIIGVGLLLGAAGAGIAGLITGSQTPTYGTGGVYGNAQNASALNTGDVNNIITTLQGELTKPDITTAQTSQINTQITSLQNALANNQPVISYKSAGEFTATPQNSFYMIGGNQLSGQQPELLTAPVTLSTYIQQQMYAVSPSEQDVFKQVIYMGLSSNPNIRGNAYGTAQVGGITNNPAITTAQLNAFYAEHGTLIDQTMNALGSAQINKNIQSPSLDNNYGYVISPNVPGLINSQVQPTQTSNIVIQMTKTQLANSINQYQQNPDIFKGVDPTRLQLLGLNPAMTFGKAGAVVLNGKYIPQYILGPNGFYTSNQASFASGASNYLSSSALNNTDQLANPTFTTMSDISASVTQGTLNVGLAQSNAASAQAKVDAAQATLATNNANYATAQTNVSNAQAAVAAANAQLAAARATAAQYGATSQQAKNALAAANTAIQQANSQLNTANAALTTATANYNTAVSALNAFKSSNMVSTQDLATANAQLASYQADAESFNENVQTEINQTATSLALQNVQRAIATNQVIQTSSTSYLTPQQIVNYKRQRHHN